MRLQTIDDLITPARVRNYSAMMAVGFLIGMIAWLGSMHANVDPYGKPFGYDFITFYAQSVMAHAGNAARAYIPFEILEVEQAVVPADMSIYLWHYPPTFALVTWPLALVPYKLAYAGFVGLTFVLYLAVIRRISDHRWCLLLALAFPAVFMNAFHGQNGFLNTAVLGFGLLLLEEQAFGAGLILGLLVYKPHFGVLLPLLFVVTGNWRAFLGACVSASLMIALSFAAFGAAPWLTFVDNLPLVRSLLESGYLPWPKIPSWFVTLRYLGVPQTVAYAVHGAVAVGVSAAMLRAWRRAGPRPLKLAMTVLAVISVSPYMFDYDLVLLALPIAWVAEYGRTTPLPPGTKAALALAFITPIVFTPIASAVHLQLMAPAILVFFGAVWRAFEAAAATEPVRRSPAPALMEQLRGAGD